MQPDSRVRRYSHFQHLWERTQAHIWRNGWSARCAWHLGAPHDVVVEEFTLEHTSVAHPPLRLAFAADFHAGPTTHPTLLDNACAQLDRAAADVLLLGGDFVCLDAKYVDDLAERLGTIHAPLGRYAVLGNHDLWTDYRHIERRLERSGIELLTNRNVRLPHPFHNVWICGLDDAWSGQPNGDAAFAGADGARIVLMHAPSGLLDIGEQRFELALCGHTHGGQIALPSGRALVVPHGELSRRYARGRFVLPESGTLIVSRGIGCSTLPFRVFSAPDIIVCNVTGISR